MFQCDLYLLHSRVSEGLTIFWFGNVLIVAMGTTYSTHVLMNSLTESAYSSMLLSDAIRNISQSTWELLVLVSVCRQGSTKWSRCQLFRKEGGAGPYMRRGS